MTIVILSVLTNFLADDLDETSTEAGINQSFTKTQTAPVIAQSISIPAIPISNLGTIGHIVILKLILEGKLREEHFSLFSCCNLGACRKKNKSAFPNCLNCLAREV